MTEKIRQWIIDNISGVNLCAVTELLNILRKEGYENNLLSPSTAHKLLGYKHSIKSLILVSKLQTTAEYIYLDVENGLIII